MQQEKSLKMSWSIASSRDLTRFQNSITNVSLHLKSYYSSECLMMIYQKNYVINIDKSEFGKLIKENYHGSPKLKPSVIINDISAVGQILLWEFNSMEITLEWYLTILLNW